MDQNDSGEQNTASETEQAHTSSTTPQTNVPSSSTDMNNVKVFAIIGYILPFLFFLPLVQDSTKNNEFARFHANQQLILLILWLIVYVLQQVLFMILFAVAFVIFPLLNLAILVLAILGIVNAAQGEMKKLPVVGDFKILK